MDIFADAQNSFSPYIYALNNPIRYIDVMGMLWADPEEAEELKSSVQSVLDRVKDKSALLARKRNERIAKGKGTKSLDRRISALGRRENELVETISDIDLLGSVKDVTFKLKNGSLGAGRHGVKQDGDIVEIYGSTNGLFVHEIRHVARSLKSSNGLRFASKSKRLVIASGTTGEADELDGYNAQFGYTGGGPGAKPTKAKRLAAIANLRDSEGKYVYPIIRREYLKRKRNERKKQ